MIGLYVFRHNAVCRLWMFRHVVCEYVGFNWCESVEIESYKVANRVLELVRDVAWAVENRQEKRIIMYTVY